MRIPSPRRVIRYLQGNKSPVYLGENRAIVRTVHRIKLMVDTTDLSLAPHILLDRQWEPSTTRFYRKIVKLGYVVIEVGSNIGYFTTMAAKLVGNSGKVYAFEANPGCYELCKENIELNGFGNIAQVKNLAVTNKSGTLMFQKFNRHQGNSTIVSKDFLGDCLDEVESIQVNSVSLDEAFQDRKVDLIKIDAEGSEALIFDGMRNIVSNNKDLKVLCEFFPARLSGAGTSPSAFLDLLTAMEFSMEVLLEDEHPVTLPRDHILGLDFCELYLRKKK